MAQPKHTDKTIQTFSTISMPNKYEANIIRLPRNKITHGPENNQDDAQSTASTTDSRSLSTATIATSVSSSTLNEPQTHKNFMSRCLWMRMLYQQCGHIYVLGLHELPCQFPHIGIVPEDSDVAQESSCSDMAQHYVKRRGVCDQCRSMERVEKKKDWLGREKVVKGVVKGEVGKRLSMVVVSARRDEWMREVEEQKRRIEAKKKG